MMLGDLENSKILVLESFIIKRKEITCPQSCRNCTGSLVKLERTLKFYVMFSNVFMGWLPHISLIFWLLRTLKISVYTFLGLWRVTETGLSLVQVLDFGIHCHLKFDSLVHWRVLRQSWNIIYLARSLNLNHILISTSHNVICCQVSFLTLFVVSASVQPWCKWVAHAVEAL